MNNRNPIHFGHWMSYHESTSTGGYGWEVPPHKPPLVPQALYWHSRQRRLSRFFMPTKIFKVEYRHYTLVWNTWLGSDMLVGGCYIGPNMTKFCSNLVDFPVSRYWCLSCKCLQTLASMTLLSWIQGKMHIVMPPPWSYMAAIIVFGHFVLN